MNIFRVNRLPLYQAPDMPADPPAPVIDPAVVAAVDPPLVADPPAPSDPPASVADDHGNKGKKPWFLDRISAESERARLAEQRAADAEALAARLQAGTTPPANDPARATQPSPQQQDFNSAVRTEAQRMRLAEDSTAVRDAGLREFGMDFGQSLSILTAVGATSDDMVLDLLAVDKTNAHKILANLAKDPEKAASLVGMDSRRRIAELTRMADAIAPPKLDAGAPPKVSPAPPARQVSRAPAPPPPVDPSASKVVDGYADEASDDQFTAQFNARMKERATRR